MRETSDDTRRVYHEQHKRIASDDRAMKRFIGMFSYNYFGLPERWFVDKRILDAGCGGTVKLLIALYNLGARDLHGFDLGADFLEVARKSLEHRGVPAKLVSLLSGNILEIPHPDNSFDFVACHGVMLHLNTIEEAEQAFSELSRVLRPDGYLYTVCGIVGGLLEDAIYPAIREHYRTNENFKIFVDSVKPEDFTDALGVIEAGIAEHEGEKVNLELFKSGMDVDLCVTIQNIVQVPVRLKLSEEWIRQQHSKHGIEGVTRLRRYVKRENIRRYFAPLHYAVDYSLSQMIYGSGNLEFIGRKVKK